MSSRGVAVQPKDSVMSFSIDTPFATFADGTTSATVPVGPDGRATSPRIRAGETAGPVRVVVEIHDPVSTAPFAAADLSVVNPLGVEQDPPAPTPPSPDPHWGARDETRLGSSPGSTTVLAATGGDGGTAAAVGGLILGVGLVIALQQRVRRRPL